MSAATDLQRVVALAMAHRGGLGHVPARQRQVLSHIGDCRTPALGGLTQRCGACAYERVRFHSCRDRHCPKCQGRASAQWAERQSAQVLAVRYFHVVFTVPEQLNRWASVHPRIVYGQLFTSAWATLSAFAANHRRLGGQGAMSAVLHTWGQTLTRHVHLHCLVPGGVFTQTRGWRGVRGEYLYPVRALSRRFRAHYVRALRARAQAGELEPLTAHDIDATLDALMDRDWVVYTKPCLGHTERVVDYLARYSHRIALSDARIVGLQHGRVGLRYLDYRDHNTRKTLWLTPQELVRRFLLHVLPKGFMRIRHYGFLANCCRAQRLNDIRELLLQSETTQPAPNPVASPSPPIPPCPPPEHCPRCTTGTMTPYRILVPIRRDSG